MRRGWSRRSVVVGVLAAPLVGRFSSARAADDALAPTPACGPATERQTEGPYFKPRSPLASDIVPKGASGTPITLAGRVLDTGCRPVDGALVELWHADDRGVYDNAGYRCRGHQFTDGRGAWTFRTILPGLYPGRTPHFHVKVQAPGGPVLTTQLYLPDSPFNGSDFLFDPDLLLALAGTGADRRGRFDFVVTHSDA